MVEALAGLLAILKLGVLVALVAAPGRRLIGLLLPDATPAERSVLGFPLGMALLAVVLAALLFARLPVRIVIVVIVVLAGFWGRRELAPLFEELRGFFRRGGAERIGVAAVLVYGALGLVGCLAPETGWDTGVYHFTMARLRAEEGWMVVRPDIPHGYRPAYQETLHTLGFLRDGERLASLMNFALYWAGFALARLWGARIGGDRVRLLAGLAYLTSTTLVLRMNGGDVEAGQAVYLSLAVYALVRLRDGGAPGWRLLAGTGLGMMLGIKYASAWAILAVAAVWLAVRLRDRAALRSLALDAGVIGSLCVAIACPWYVRNALVVGNPFYPFRDVGAGSGVVESGFLKPLLLSVGMDLFLLAAIPGAALARSAKVRWIGAAAVLFLLLLLRHMGITPQNVVNALRYASPAYPLLFLLGALAVEEALSRGRAARILGGAFLAGALAISLGAHAARNGPKVPVALGLKPRDAFLEERVNSSWAMKDAARDLPAGKKVLLVEQRAYYCRAPFLTASDLQTHVDFDRLGTVNDFRAFLEVHSIGAIVYNRSASAKTWGFQRLEKRLGPEFPAAGVSLRETRRETSLYRVN